MSHQLPFRQPTTAIPASAHPATLLAVALGGVLGATARWMVGVVTPGTADAAASWPWATLIVNLLGCVAIGVVTSRIERSSVAWHFTVTGLLGGFTTMSSFAAETNELFDNDRPIAGALYLGCTLAGGLFAVAATQRLGGGRDAAIGWPRSARKSL